MRARLQLSSRARDAARQAKCRVGRGAPPGVVEVLLGHFELSGGALELGRIGGASGRAHAPLGGDQRLPPPVEVLINGGTSRRRIAAGKEQGQADDRADQTKASHQELSCPTSNKERAPLAPAQQSRGLVRRERGCR